MVQTFLDDVIAVDVLDELDDIVAQSFDDQVSLLSGRQKLDHSLQSAGTMLVERDLRHVWHNFLNENGALLIVGMLKQALAKIIAEGVGHELNEVILHLLEDDLNVLLIVFFELTLQEATAMLILAESIDLPWKI